MSKVSEKLFWVDFIKKYGNGFIEIMKRDNIVNYNNKDKKLCFYWDNVSMKNKINEILHYGDVYKDMKDMKGETLEENLKKNHYFRRELLF